MKARRLKALGFTLLGSLALLFAGCGQQAGGGQPGGGQEPPKPIQASVTGVTPDGRPLTSGGVVAGVLNVSVSINEDSQVQEVALFVNDTLVARYNIGSQGIRPQALRYDFTVNTAACDRAFLTVATATGCSETNNTPLFPNGTYQIKAVVKNAVETKTISVPVVLDNRDRIIFTISGNSAQDANGDTWYGNGDVTVKGVIFSYTGATYTFQRVNATTWRINRTGGQAANNNNFLPSDDQNITGGATLSSASGTDLVFAKSDNAISSPVGYHGLPPEYFLETPPTLRIDNLPPNPPVLEVQRLYDETPVPATLGIPVSKSTKLFFTGGDDHGSPSSRVGTDPASFQVTLEFGTPIPQTVIKGRGDSLDDLPNGNYNIAVKKLVLKDRLGNTREVTGGLPTLNFNTNPPSLNFNAAPAGTATAGAAYIIDISYAAGAFHTVALALKQGENRYLLQDLVSGVNNWTAFKLGGGPSATMNLAVVAIDLHGNVQEADFNVVVFSPAGAAEQQPPVVNSLTASAALTAGNPLSTATLFARVSDQPIHSPIFFIHFFRQHSNAGQYFVPIPYPSWLPSVGVYIPGPSEDAATSVPASGDTYPRSGTFGTAVLVRDNDFNAALGTGTLTVNP